MGISKGVKALLHESKRRSFSGSVLELGKQDVWFSDAQLQGVAREIGVFLAPAEIELSPKPEYSTKGFISDVSLFKRLGFSEVLSSDSSDYEDADIILDLNSSKIPPELKSRFDVVFDGGTLEHVFHLPNALNNVFEMLKTGGRVIHISPSSNHIDHGFHQFSPTLFHDFYTVNQWDINTLQVFRYGPSHDEETWYVSNYEVGCLDRVSFGGLDSGMYGIICVATKTEYSTGNKIPQQSAYHHGNYQGADSWSEPPSVELEPNLKRRLGALCPPLYDALGKAKARQIKEPSAGLGLEVVARY